jgi:DNA-binding response OmpR family regulator
MVAHPRLQGSRRGLSFREFEHPSSPRDEARRGRHEREELMKLALGYSAQKTSRAVDDLIPTLHEGGRRPSGPRHIFTADGIGYQLVV